MSLRGGLLLFPTKQSPVDWEVASGERQERPRNDMDGRGVFWKWLLAGNIVFIS